MKRTTNKKVQRFLRMTPESVNNNLFKYAKKVLNLKIYSIVEMFTYIETHDNKNTNLLMNKWEELNPTFLELY